MTRYKVSVYEFQRSWNEEHRPDPEKLAERLEKEQPGASLRIEVEEVEDDVSE